MPRSPRASLPGGPWGQASASGLPTPCRQSTRGMHYDILECWLSIYYHQVRCCFHLQR